MKPPPFAYHAPASVAAVIDLLASLDNARLLAGGQSLMPMLNMRFAFPDHMIDLNRVRGLSERPEGRRDSDRRHDPPTRDLEFSPQMQARCRCWHEALRKFGHRQTRNRGTIGGSLCHLDPRRELVRCVAPMTAVDIAVTARQRGRSPFSAIAAGVHDAGDRADEMLTGDRSALAAPGTAAASSNSTPARRFRHRRGRRAA